jgi:enamine deaminase RidA (YjgF/YER057c/UK114 family)
VAGTTALDEHGQPFAPGDAAAQTRRALEIIREALRMADARLEDVVRTRLYVTDIDRWEEVARVHGEFFGTIRPATAMVEVSRLIHPDLVVEIEAEALLEPR